MRRLNAVSAILLTIAVIFLAPGCAFEPLGADNWTAGQRDRVRFSWGTGWGCFFGCDLERRLMVGTVETLKVHPNDWPVATAPAAEQLRAESSAPALFRTEVVPIVVDRDDAGGVTRVIPAVRVWALASGAATIRIFDSDDELVDEIEVTAVLPDRIILLTGSDIESSPPIELGEGDERTFNARALDESGRDLSASFGWGFTTDDPSVAALWNNSPDGGGVSSLSAVENFATVFGRRRGDTVLRATVTGVEASVEVHVD